MNISAWDFRNFKYSFDKDEIVAEGEQQQRKRKERREDEEGKKNKREKEGSGCREERKWYPIIWESWFGNLYWTTCKYSLCKNRGHGDLSKSFSLSNSNILKI